MQPSVLPLRFRRTNGKLPHPLAAIKKKAVWTGALFLLALLGTAGPLDAEESRSPGEPVRPEVYPATDRFWISPFAGVIFYGGLKPLPNTGILEDLARPEGFLIGIRATWLIRPHVLMEGTLSRSTTENVHQLLFYDPDPLEGNPPFGIQTLRNTISPVWRAGGNMSFLLPVRGRIVPHLSAGLGWIRHSPRDQVAATVIVPLGDGTVFADTIGVPEANVRLPDQDWLSVDLGGGFSGEVSRIMAVRFDAILHVSKFSQIDVEGPLTGDVFYAGPQWVTDLELSAGIVFRF